jgi:outer membrane receptor protein involved in Fe transport
MLLLFLLCGHPFAAETPANVDPTGYFSAPARWLVADAATGLPLVGATVRLEHDSVPLMTDSAGLFALPDGRSYSVIISHVGYKTRRVICRPSVSPQKPILITLEQQPVSLAGMTVTPGHFAIEDDIPVSSQSLRCEAIQSTPQFGEDLHRAVSRLPGLASNEFSARFIVRGGEYDQMLVLFDGMELEEPFHLRDIDGGVISIVDIAAIRSIDLATGGFSARYGDRVSGVFDLASRTVAMDGNRYETAISLTNLRAFGEGRFADQRGSWLVSARHGYAEWALEMSGHDEDIKPKYYDLFAKSAFSLSPDAELALHLLHGHDNLYFSQSSYDRATMIYDNSYAWLTLTARPTGRLSSVTVLGLADMSHDREGYSESRRFGQGRYQVDDRRNYTAPSLRQELEFDLAPELLISAGLQYRQLAAKYDYQAVAEDQVVDIYGRPQTAMSTVNREVTRRAEIWGVYLSPRVRLIDRVIVEAGLRFDRNSIGNDRITSPRAGILWRLSEKTSLRAGWGRYAQFQRLYDLAIAENDLSYFNAMHSEHFVLGFEHEFSATTRVRVETYRKHLTHLPPVYRNWLDPVTLFPEIGLDRIRVERSEANSRGLEFYLSHTGSSRFNWRLGYSLTEVTEHITQYEMEGYVVAFDSTVPGPYDQRHAVTVDLSYQPNPQWLWTLAWQYRSGWPYTAAELVTTPFVVYTVPESPMSSRYPVCHRLDLRLTRTFETHNGRISVFAEIMNLYDRHNTRAIQYSLNTHSGSRIVLDRDPVSYLGITPSIGFIWRFGG